MAKAKLHFSSTVSQNVGVTFDQVKELLGLFSKSFDDKFNAINSRIDVISQESNRSFSAPSVIAGRNEPTPDRTPFAAYSDILGANLGGLAATEESSDVGFPSQMMLGEFLARIKDLECKFGYLPDNFLNSLRGKVIHSPDYSLYLSDDAILDSLLSFRTRLWVPISSLPGLSRDSHSVIPFLCSLLGVANPYPPVSSGVSSARAPGDSGLSVLLRVGRLVCLSRLRYRLSLLCWLVGSLLRWLGVSLQWSLVALLHRSLIVLPLLSLAVSLRRSSRRSLGGLLLRSLVGSHRLSLVVWLRRSLVWFLLGQVILFTLLVCLFLLAVLLQ